MNPLMLLSILLALSSAGNLYQYHENGKLHTELGGLKTANAAANNAAQACSSSIDKLTTATDDRAKTLLAAMQRINPQLRALQAGVTQTLNKQPIDPSDLCKSALLLSQQELAAFKSGQEPGKSGAQSTSSGARVPAPLPLTQTQQLSIKGVSNVTR